MEGSPGNPGVVAASPQQSAWSFHQTLVEILRYLNQAAERQTGVDGLELVELERTMARFWTHGSLQGRVPEALRLLQENRLVAQESEPVYAWDRSRVLGDRYRITPDGKAYLLRQLQATDRIR